MKNRLKPEQISAIKRSSAIGRDLQVAHPKIIDMYREGKTLEEIADELDISLSYGVNERISITSVGHALRGYDGYFGGTSYIGLGEETELDRLEEDHKLKGLDKGYLKGIETMRRNTLGIFGLTKKQLSEQGRVGGKKGGKTTLDKNLGIHSLSYEERQKVGYTAVISQGKLPWIKREETPELTRFGELEFAYILWQTPEYRHKCGKANGKPHWNLITKRINEIYHMGQEVRTLNVVKVALNKSIREGRFSQS
jgi:DNA-directed RNA polymerase subunit H (RpoH/RPB5)